MPRGDDIPRKSEQELVESTILHILVKRRKIATDELLAEAAIGARSYGQVEHKA